MVDVDGMLTELAHQREGENRFCAQLQVRGRGDDDGLWKSSSDALHASWKSDGS